MKHWVLAAVVIATLAAADAKETSIAGTWTFSVERIGLKLVLEQKEDAVTGTLDWPHGDPIKLSGVFTGDTLMFAGESAGENFNVHVNSIGSRKADGTLAGTVKAHFDEFNEAQETVLVRTQEIPCT